jgi:hypothetical protein
MTGNSPTVAKAIEDDGGKRITNPTRMTRLMTLSIRCLSGFLRRRVWFIFITY